MTSPVCTTCLRSRSDTIRIPIRCLACALMKYRFSATAFRRPEMFSAAIGLSHLAACCDAFRVQIGPQGLGNNDAAVGLLVVLHDRHPGAADGEAAAVERVDEVGLAAGVRAIADIHPPRLEGFEVAARGDLIELIQPRQPHFDVVGLAARETEAA